MVDLDGQLETVDRRGAVTEDPAGVVGQHIDTSRAGRLGELTGQSAHLVETGEVRHESLDRKSTRLNSSHVAISYAVFCLKKKTQQTNERSAKAPTRTR